MPLGVLAPTTRDPTSITSDEDDDPIEFQGAWCASVSNSAAVAAFSDSDVHPVELTSFDVDDTNLLSDPNLNGIDSPRDDDLSCLFNLSSVEREMFLQVERDLFPGSATHTKIEGPTRRLEREVSVVTADDENALTPFVLDLLMAPSPMQYEDVPALSNFVVTIAEWLFPSFSANTTIQSATDVFWIPDWIQGCIWVPLLFLVNHVCRLLQWSIDLFLRHSGLAIGIFSITMLVWEWWLAVTRFIRTSSPGLPRHERRRLDKLIRARNKTPGTRKLPLLAFVPAAWMVLTHVCTLPINNSAFSSFRSFDTSSLFHVIHEIKQNITYLNQLMELDTNVLIQMNDIKGTHLFYSIVSTNDDVVAFQVRPIVIKAKAKLRTFDKQFSSSESIGSHSVVAYGPTTVEPSTRTPMLIPDFKTVITSAESDPSVFMTFTNRSTIRQPVIFDTGASLAITPDKSDFDHGTLSVPQGDLRLGGMANGLKIEGMGPVTWTFSNGVSDEVVVRGMAYYVPKSKARLLSPQRLFDSSTGTQGRYEGDQHSFRLYFADNPPLIVEYDERNSLPIGYAAIGPVPSPQHQPQLNLAILNNDNQNLTAAQKLLLQ